MILYPAIDLKDGACVRLVRGAMDQATLFNPDPADQARSFEAAGFSWLHLVDLNGAFEGRPVNGDAISRILAAISIPIQLGGGIRDIETVRFWIAQGISRVILGTAAVRDPAFVREACRVFPGQIALGVDARDGFVAVEGWADTTTLSALEVAKRFEDCGAAALIFTDIARDGVLGGVNVPATVALAKAISIPVIASGGVAGLGDLEALTAEAGGALNGVIAGRALYDGRLDARAALALLRGEGPDA